MNYRADIDGLRAVAVVPVILFHAGFEIFSGGYVGVDVFFVISGYLITTIFLNELDQDRFSIVKFYERRVRRILPALLLVIACTIPFAWIWMLPTEFTSYADSIIHTLFFLSNVFFYNAEDYFAPAAELQPMLHTWSLAVEEQYYIFAPLVAAYFWRFGTATFAKISVAIGLASLIFCVVLINIDPSFTFYMPFTRVWELQVGALCALIQFKKPQGANSALGLLGLTLVVAPIILFDASTPFPSLYTLMPVLGVALIILFGGPSTPATTILSMRPFVWIGLVSYSAYLWHQPLFAFARIRSVDEPTQTLMGILAVASLMLAFLSWRFVEQPFRSRPEPLLADYRSLFGTALASIVAITLLSLLVINQKGFNSRAMAKENSEIERRLTNHHKNYRICAKNDMEDQNFKDSCIFGSGEPSLMLFGDSFAMHLFEAFKQSATSGAIIMKTMASCAPILGLVKTDNKRGSGWRQECMQHNDQALKYLSENVQLETVVMSSPFATAKSAMELRDGKNVPAGDNLDLLVKQFLETVQKIRSSE